MANVETLRLNPLQEFEEYRLHRTLLHEASMNALVLVSHHIHAGTFAKLGKFHFPNGYDLIPEVSDQNQIQGLSITRWEPNYDREELIIRPRGFAYTSSRKRCMNIVKRTYTYDTGEVLGQYSQLIFQLEAIEQFTLRAALRSELGEAETISSAKIRLDAVRAYMDQVIEVLEQITFHPTLLTHSDLNPTPALENEAVASL